MTLVEIVFPVADCVVGEDLIAKFKWASENERPRKIVAMGCVGSASAGDTRLGVFYGSVKVGQIYNNDTGLVLNFNDDVRTNSSMMFCPANKALGLIVEDAPSTNDIKVFMDVQEL